jgi:hypothetical protein
MTPEEYNKFLKIRRTSKLFERDVGIQEYQKQLIIDAVNFAPAQNSNRNFIPLLIEKQEHKEWLQDNIFYFPPSYSGALEKEMPTEYQLGVLTAPMIVVYLKASKNLPIVNRGEAAEPSQGDIDIRNINIGLNMAFVANQAYLLGLDVGFTGCSRGLRNVMDTPELKAKLFSIYNEYGITDDFATRHSLAPGYAVCIGKAVPISNPTEPTLEDMAGFQYKDGFYTNLKKHSLNSMENVRLINE